MITRIVVTLGRVFNEIPRYPAIYITPCIDIEAFIKGTWVGDETSSELQRVIMISYYSSYCIMLAATYIIGCFLKMKIKISSLGSDKFNNKERRNLNSNNEKAINFAFISFY